MISRREDAGHNTVCESLAYGVPLVVAEASFAAAGGAAKAAVLLEAVA